MLEYAIPAVVVLLCGGSFGMSRARERRQQQAMTPARKQLYMAALQSLKDPDELRKLADAFESQGLVNEAKVLRTRASNRELPKETNEKRRQVFRDLMSCLDAAKVIEGADAFSECACFSAAANLRKYASGLSSDSPEFIADVALDLKKNCEIIPETGEVRSIATRKAIRNLLDRANQLSTPKTDVSKDAGKAVT
jgi:hypothetical protein